METKERIRELTSILTTEIDKSTAEGNLLDTIELDVDIRLLGEMKLESIFKMTMRKD